MFGLAGSAGSTCLVWLAALDRHVWFCWARWIDMFCLVGRSGLTCLVWFGALAWRCCCEWNSLRQPALFFNCSYLKGVCAELLWESHLAGDYLPPSVYSRVFSKEICILGLVCTGLASLEDYFSHSTPCYLTRSSCLVWCVQGWTSCWTGSPHWRITSASALLDI